MLTGVSMAGFAVTLRVVILVLTMSALSLMGAGVPQEVYVWQRAWTEPVRSAVREHGELFASIVVLKAEVTWIGEESRLAQVPIDYDSLIKTKRPIGIALRVGPYSGVFDRTDRATRYLADLTQKVVTDSKRAGLAPCELQLDFDCASSRLDGYRTWVEVIRQRIAPVPLVITALPSWLERASFKPLVQAASGYVLQVHSLDRPKSFDARFTLCDPTAARRAVAQAEKIGVPFRVALPTYGYVMAFDAHGSFIGLSAEGPAKNWPSDAQLKEVRADPLEIGQLANEWSSNPSASLKGVLWYRLPVSGDVLNWRWPTFSAILQQRIPRKSVRADLRRVEPGLSEFSLVNDGELDISSRLALQIRWRGARFVAGDGLRDFELRGQGTSSARFESSARPYRLPAGERQVVGWLRLSEDREVEVELEELGGR